jgi:hypothetical protein
MEGTSSEDERGQPGSRSSETAERAPQKRHVAQFVAHGQSEGDVLEVLRQPLEESLIYI